MVNMKHQIFLYWVLITQSIAIPLLERLSRRHARGRRLLAPDDQCAAELWSLEHHVIQIVHPVDLQGHWVSSECEIHPGPKYILRDYQFYKNGNFLIRHYEYKDDACTNPLYGFTASGDIVHLSKSWAVPGGIESTHSLSQVTIVPYTKSAAKSLTMALRRNCRLESSKSFDWPWLEEYRDYVIYSNPNEDTEESMEIENLSTDNPAEVDCLHSANFTVTHLSLLRMEEMMESSTERPDQYFLRRLYFGKAISENGTYRRPSSFLEPLVDADQMTNCKTCQRIAGSNPLSPPRLKLSDLPDDASEYILRPYSSLDQLDGDWLSTRCESYEHGMYGHRRMTFSTSAQSWHLRQRYYNDPLCKHASFTVLADGVYTLTTDGGGEPDADRVSYTLERVKLVPESRSIVHNLRRAERCGPSNKWRQGRAVDISEYGGCEPLGITVPAVTKDIIKVKSIIDAGRDDTKGRLFLFTGDYATAPSSQQYPTGFQSPMVKCAEVTVVVSLDTSESNAISPQSPNGRYGINFSKWQSNSSPALVAGKLVALLLVVHNVIQM